MYVSFVLKENIYMFLSCTYKYEYLFNEKGERDISMLLNCHCIVSPEM